MLFIEDPYLKEFDAKILNINLNHITLDQTAFYARSGGQPGDVGQLTINRNTIRLLIPLKIRKTILFILPKIILN